jgi:hypothetical protein
VAAAEERLVAQARVCGPKDLDLFASRVVTAVDPDRPEPIDDQLQQDRRHLELRQRRDGMWQLEGRLTNTVGAQLHAILDPLTRPCTSTIEVDGKTTEIPDPRHYGQRSMMPSRMPAAGCCSWLTGPRWVAPQHR